MGDRGGRGDAGDGEGDCERGSQDGSLLHLSSSTGFAGFYAWRRAADC
jgi:hypothetical protein